MTLTCSVDTTEVLIDKLIEFFTAYENHFPNVTRTDLQYYFRQLITKDRIIVYMENEEIQGYAEWFNINYAQFGWIICDNHFNVGTQDIEHGNIAYLANVLVKPGS